MTAIRKKVWYTPTIRYEKTESGWIARCLETGLVGTGSTQEAAYLECISLHNILVKAKKREGLEALKEFMHNHSLNFKIGTVWYYAPSFLWTLAIIVNVKDSEPLAS